MALRCLLFTADDSILAPICQVLAELGIEEEHCAEASTAVEKVTGTLLQIVIIDWDRQPEAGTLLNAARVRKPNERPLMLAVVSNDASVPKALQAGANSILRKPLVASQVTDTLTTARDLLRAKVNAANAVQAATVSSGTAPTQPAGAEYDKILRAGDLLEAPNSTPGSSFVPDSTATIPLEFTNEQVRPLKDLEPVAASVKETAAPPPPSQQDNEPRGLEWYLKNRGVQRPGPSQAAAAAAPAPAPAAAAGKTELLSFDQTPSFAGRRSEPLPEAEQKVHDQKEEQRLFAYIDGEEEQTEKKKKTGSAFPFGKKAIIAAVFVAACAVAAAPQAPWHPQVKGLWKRGQLAVHAWLNPQLVTTPQAPVSHENFGRAGDEYKLPPVESIPDATTDPSQIRVVPVVDPTKKPSNGANPDEPQTAPDGSASATPDQGVQVQENQPGQPGSDPFKPTDSSAPTTTQASPPQVQPPAPSQSTEQPRPAPQVPSSLLAPPISQPTITTNPATQPSGNVTTPGNVPSSLKSHMASMTPESSGNKPVENALPPIEPVAVSEAVERVLIIDQPTIPYPTSAKGQQGTVVLQLLIGRDGTVQDAKFQQGSLAFARAAIDGVKQWKFKPYTLNGRPVSVQTTMSVSLKPGS